jgi:uncharacterized membrane protein
MVLLLLLLFLVVCFFVSSFLREALVLFLMSGAVEGMGVVRGLIVTRVAANGLGPTVGEHIGLALRALTGLQTLGLDST